MATLTVLGLVAAVSIGLTGIGSAREPQGAPAKASKMPRERAQATFDDPRVKAFMKLVTSPEIGGTCSLPDSTKVEARVIAPGPFPPGVTPDFASTRYGVTIPCPGKEGLASVSIEAEFVPLMSGPLNLTMSLEYRK